MTADLYIHKGVIILYNCQNERELKIAVSYASRLLKEKGKVSVLVDSTKKRRTSKENRYYWKVIVSMCSIHTKESQRDQHEIFKDEVLGRYEIRKPTGEIITRSRSTATLTTQEFEDYAQHCRMLAFELYGLNCPLPNEVIYTDEMYKGV